MNLRSGFLLAAFVSTLEPASSLPAAPVDQELSASIEEQAVLEKSLVDLTIELGGASHEIAEIHVHGLQTIGDETFARFLADRLAPPISSKKAVDLMRALASTGLFARITPTLRLPIAPDANPMLDLLVAEYPVVRDVVIQGSDEIARDDVLDDLMGNPASGGCTGAETEGRTRRLCAPVEWYARIEHGEIVPGVLWRGPSGAARRVLSRLFEAGYRMATVTAELSADGTLTLDVDEGRIEKVLVSGVAASLVDPVRERMALRPGGVFLETDVLAALKRVEHAFPFLKQAPDARRTRALPDLVEERTTDGGIRVQTRERSPEAVPALSYVVADRAVEVFFRSTFALVVGLNGSELPRNTPVGGAGFGLHLNLSLLDSSNRVHLRTDSYAGSVDKSLLDVLGKEVGESAGQIRLQIPPLRVAELGLEARNWIETSEQWRMDRYESYLYSLFFNKPEMEYYWNESSSIFITLLPTKRLLVGCEYQFSKYFSTPSLDKPHCFFGCDKPWPNPAIDDGTIGSLLLRLEYSTDPIETRSIGGVFRSNETSLVKRPRTWGMRTAFHTLNTFEVASPTLDSDDGFDFTRFISDNKLILASGASSGLRLRLRLMLGSHLPRQRQDGLGGWSALRGFDFKEFRGDRSILGVIEYRRDWISGFLDVGSVREPERGWSGPHFGAGAKLHLDDLSIFRNRLRLGPLQLVAAWRIDDKIKAAPQVRLQFHHLF